jgi:thiamine pyrophosphokinase
VSQERSQFVVVTSGEGPAVATPSGATVIAADGGLERAVAAGLQVDIAIGDFDSAPAHLVEAAERAGTRIVRHPARKDATDLELALDEAVALGAASIVVLGSDGGRLDHLAAGLLLLGSSAYRGVTVDAVLGETHVAVIHDARTLTGAVGDTLSLLPVNGPVVGVATTGLEYPLRGERLDPGTTRGVSNVFAATTATVTLEQGTLLALRPGRIP